MKTITSVKTFALMENHHKAINFTLQDKTERSTYDIQMEDYLIQSLQTDAKEKDFQIRYALKFMHLKYH